MFNKFILKDINSKRGFTLIELLIVIAILGALVAVGIQTFPASQRKARDANRKSDLKQYQTALEVYANKNNGLYPNSDSSAIVIPTLCGSGEPLGDLECSTDPKDGEVECSGLTCRYFYRTPDCGAADAACATSYMIWAALENPSDVGDKSFVVCSNGLSGEGDAPTDTSCTL